MRWTAAATLRHCFRGTGDAVFLEQHHVYRAAGPLSGALSLCGSDGPSGPDCQRHHQGAGKCPDLFDDTPTISTGLVREFHTPPLTPGTRYGYNIRASWTENGRELVHTQQIPVVAGQRAEVDFQAAPKTTE